MKSFAPGLKEASVCVFTDNPVTRSNSVRNAHRFAAIEDCLTMMQVRRKISKFVEQKNGELFPVRRFEFRFAYRPLLMMYFSKSPTRLE